MEGEGQGYPDTPDQSSMRLQEEHELTHFVTEKGKSVRSDGERMQPEKRIHQPPPIVYESSRRGVQLGSVS